MCTYYTERHLCSYQVLVNRYDRDGPRKYCGLKAVDKSDTIREKTICPNVFSEPYRCNRLEKITSDVHKDNEYCTNHEGGTDKYKTAKAGRDRENRAAVRRMSQPKAVATRKANDAKKA